MKKNYSTITKLLSMFSVILITVFCYCNFSFKDNQIHALDFTGDDLTGTIWRITGTNTFRGYVNYYSYPLSFWGKISSGSYSCEFSPSSSNFFNFGTSSWDSGYYLFILANSGGYSGYYNPNNSTFVIRPTSSYSISYNVSYLDVEFTSINTSTTYYSNSLSATISWLQSNATCIYIPSSSVELDPVTNLSYNQYTGVLSWDSVTNADYYKVYTSQSSTTLSNMSVATTTTSTSITTQTNGYYRVVACSNDTSSYTDSTSSSYVTCTYVGQTQLATPTGLNQVDNTVYWSAVSNADYYQIQTLNRSSNTWSNKFTTTATNFTLGSNNLSYGYIRVIACSNSDQYTNSNASAYLNCQIKTQCSQPSVSVSGYKIVISNSLEDCGATQWNIYYSSTSSGTFTLIDSITSSSYYGTMGYYYVKAYNSNSNYIESVASSTVYLGDVITLDEPTIELRYSSSNDVSIYFITGTTVQFADQMLVYKDDVLVSTISVVNGQYAYNLASSDYAGNYYIIAHDSTGNYADSVKSNVIRVSSNTISSDNYYNELQNNFDDYEDNFIDNFNNSWNNISSFSWGSIATQVSNAGSFITSTFNSFIYSADGSMNVFGKCLEFSLILGLICLILGKSF